MAPENLAIYLQRKDKSIADISDEVRERLGLAVITEDDRLVTFSWTMAR
jgi:hypothetical protein